MTLLEALALQLGPAIAKSILKLWMKDQKLAADITSNLIDFIKSKTTDVVIQQRAKRQFEEIGEKVAESLLVMFDADGATLDESSRTAVALAVAETFNKSQIDPALLLKRDLEPSALARYIIDFNPRVTEHFSSVETMLFQRAIFESCQYIVDIASQLPAFTERTFAEILKREHQLLAVANQILEEVRHILDKSQGMNLLADAVRFETEYRRAVMRKLDELELFGLDVSSASRRHRLSIAYVTLSVERTWTRSGDISSVYAKAIKNMDDAGNEEDEGSREIILVDDILGRLNRLVIRGLAGSGKTTLLQWVAVRSASQTFEGQLSNLNETIPFFIRLRQCAESGLPAPESFVRLLTPAIAATMPSGWVHKQLDAGRALVLIDGVDEVPQLQRPAVREWLKELVETYRETRFIISSRPHAIEEGWLAQEDFDEAELQLMDLPSINAFVDHWHSAVREQVQAEGEWEELEHLAEHIKRVIRDSRSLRDLAATPLLCAMLCALHRDRRQRLPSDRVELYEACCNALIERRDPERGIALSSYPNLTYRQKRVLLQDLAYWLLKNGWSEVSRERADHRLTLRVANMPGIPQGVSGEHVRQLLVERSGIIREPVSGSIDFTHRTFQEFLAAQGALDEEDIGLLVSKAHDDQWQETIILAAGLAGLKVREDLITKLIVRGDADSQYRHALHLLAIACLETSVELGPEVKAEVQKRLTALIPPKNFREAKALASAGELALPFLTESRRRHRAPVAAACIRTLMLIGGEVGLETLERYTSDTRQPVVNELLRASAYFDRQEYIRRILSKILPKVEYLRLQEISLLEDIWPYLTALTSLNLFSRTGRTNLQLVAKLTYLRSLSLSEYGQVKEYGQEADLQPLAELTNLQRLDLTYFGQVTDLRPLAGLTTLRSLSLSGFGHVTDLRPLAELTNLRELSLSGFGQVRDLKLVAELTNLRSLYLWHFGQVTDLRPLTKLTDLEGLTLSHMDQATDLRPLAELTNLRELSLTYMDQVTDLRPLAGLTNLRSLSLWHYEWIRVGDLRPLAELTNLRELYLSGFGQVTDLRPLAGLTSLRSLSLSGFGQVTNLQPLAELTNLQVVRLSGLKAGVEIPTEITRKVKVS